jgi:hypothetical protein
MPIVMTAIAATMNPGVVHLIFFICFSRLTVFPGVYVSRSGQTRTLVRYEMLKPHYAGPFIGLSVVSGSAVTFLVTAREFRVSIGKCLRRQRTYMTG